MTDEHVWVTIGGKRLYVGKKAPDVELKVMERLYAGKVPETKPKRRRAPYTPPQEIFDVD